MVGRCISYWNNPFLGDMLVFWGVILLGVVFFFVKTAFLWMPTCFVRLGMSHTDPPKELKWKEALDLLQILRPTDPPELPTQGEPNLWNNSIRNRSCRNWCTWCRFLQLIVIFLCRFLFWRNHLGGELLWKRWLLDEFLKFWGWHVFISSNEKAIDMQHTFGCFQK